MKKVGYANFVLLLNNVIVVTGKIDVLPDSGCCQIVINNR